MSKRNVAILVVLLVVVAAGYWFTGGGAAFGPKPTPTPDLAALSDLDNLITASGTLLPARRASLSFKVGGQIVELAVKAGDTVNKGSVLARLDAAEARAAVAIAQAQLDQAKAGATKEDIAAAQANVETAQAQLAKVRAGPTLEDIAIAKATFDQAASGLKDAQSAYDKIKDDPSAGMFPQSLAYEAATQQYRIAEAKYAQVVKGATPDDIRVAEANLAAAQANLSRVKAGTRVEEIAAAQARLDQAQAMLAATTLTAPFDGVVAAINNKEGEMASPGVPVLTLGDLSNLRLETDDLSESNIARVKLNQTVAVSFEALPGQTFPGQVTQIALISTAKSGGTNYTVTIEFQKLDPALRWGMTGHVEIKAAP